MDERLIYASGRTLRRRQLVGVVAAAAVVLGGVYLGFSGFEWGVAVPLVVALVCLLVAVEMRIRRPLPELRLSTDGKARAPSSLLEASLVHVTRDRAAG